jgi:hypothetical protein
MTKGIPETYDIKKIVETLIQENILQRSQVDLIIEKVRPKSVELNSSLSTG